MLTCWMWVYLCTPRAEEVLVPGWELEHSLAADLQRGDRDRSLSTTCRGYCQGLQTAETGILINEEKDRFYTEKVFWISASKGSCRNICHWYRTWEQAGANGDCLWELEVMDYQVIMLEQLVMSVAKRADGTWMCLGRGWWQYLCFLKYPPPLELVSLNAYLQFKIY